MSVNPGKLLFDDLKVFGGAEAEDAATWIGMLEHALLRWLAEDSHNLILGEVEMFVIQKKLKDVALTWSRAWWNEMKTKAMTKKDLPLELFSFEHKTPMKPENPKRS